MNNIPECIRAWERGEGPNTLRACGASEGCRVLDFGFGQGHYSLAASAAVGPAGQVFSLDQNAEAIAAFRARIGEEGVQNIQIKASCGGIFIPLGDGVVDFMMLYDIIHHVQADWIELMAEARRVLKIGGVLSVLPFHLDSAAVEMLFAETTFTGFSAPVLLPDAGLHIGMAYRVLQSNPAMDLADAERGAIYNFTRI